MTFTRQIVAVRGSSDLQRETVTRYLDRDRLGTYLFASAVVASGVASWGRQAAARLFPILEFLPVVLIMLMYMSPDHAGRMMMRQPVKRSEPQ
jgi:hypothetical protein